MREDFSYSAGALVFIVVIKAYIKAFTNIEKRKSIGYFCMRIVFMILACK